MTAETSGDLATTPILTIEGAVATLRLNRPRHLNRIEPEDLAALNAILDEVEAVRSLRVLVLTGTGRAFSSGYHLGDIGSRAAPEPEGEAIGPMPFEAFANRLEDCALPTICRLNGSVYGGSTDLALACDFRIGLDGIQMFMPAARLGLHYYRGGMVRFVTRLGPTATKALFLTARTIDSAEMLRIGYLTETAPPGGLDERVAALAACLAANAPLATRGMKRTINDIARNSLDEPAADRRYRDSLRGEEVREGTQAFAEKRAPRFAD